LVLQINFKGFNFVAKNIFHRFMYSFLLFKTVASWRRRKVKKAHLYSIKMSRHARSENLYCFLLRSYLGFLSEDYDDSYACLVNFFDICRRALAWDLYQINEDEKKWLILFAAYIELGAFGELDQRLYVNVLVDFSDINSVNIDNVRGIYKEILSPLHIPKMKEVFEKRELS